MCFMSTVKMIVWDEQIAFKGWEKYDFTESLCYVRFVKQSPLTNDD